jgi:hypothetical protein
MLSMLGMWGSEGRLMPKTGNQPRRFGPLDNRTASTVEQLPTLDRRTGPVPSHQLRERIINRRLGEVGQSIAYVEVGLFVGFGQRRGLDDLAIGGRRDRIIRQ